MKPHVLRTVPGLKAPAVKKPPMPGRGGGFYPARRILLIRRAPAARQGTCVTNITNHLRLVNHLLVHVRIAGGAHVAGAAAAPVWKTAGVVSAVLDAVLREQLERELALMERGENIGANQRRRAMLRRTLETKPSRIVRNFYAVQMRTLTRDSSATEKTEEFYSDIVHERVQTNHRYYEQRTERVIESAPKAAPVGEQEVHRIADQVMRQLDKRMKLQRDRNGVW